MLIGIAGEKQTGKDTLAQMFMQSGFARYAFADHLRKAASMIFKIPIASFTDADKKDVPFTRKRFLGLYEEECREELTAKRVEALVMYFISIYKTTKIHRDMFVLRDRSFRTPRDILQFLGTDLMRNYLGHDFHVEWVFSQIMTQGHDHVVIADCRHANERLSIKQVGGYNVLIKRKNNLPVDRHESENDLGKDEDYDFVIENNKSISVLKDQVDHILLEILNTKSQEK